MPEGPEVRKYADAVDRALTGNTITIVEARTRDARAWLKDNENRLIGRRVDRVFSHGKHLIGLIEGGFFFHAHLMMWGRWLTLNFTKRTKGKGTDSTALERDRRERARIITDRGAAILLSAPIFNIGQGDPYDQIENLKSLGPDALPYNRRFERVKFHRRLMTPEHAAVEIGAALLNQRIVAGLGNYLRAEILFACKLDPWRTVKDLSEQNLNCLMQTIPRLTRRSYERGATAPNRDRERMAGDESLVYQPGREHGTRHMVFRRTNLPCLRCKEPIRQIRQRTHNPEPSQNDQERTRITYFCTNCQQVNANAAHST